MRKFTAALRLLGRFFRAAVHELVANWLFFLSPYLGCLFVNRVLGYRPWTMVVVLSVVSVLAGVLHNFVRLLDAATAAGSMTRYVYSGHTVDGRTWLVRLIAYLVASVDATIEAEAVAHERRAAQTGDITEVDS